MGAFAAFRKAQQTRAFAVRKLRRCSFGRRLLDSDGVELERPIKLAVTVPYR